jgi:hypothetical protein
MRISSKIKAKRQGALLGLPQNFSNPRLDEAKESKSRVLPIPLIFLPSNDSLYINLACSIFILENSQ